MADFRTWRRVGLGVVLALALIAIFVLDLTVGSIDVTVFPYFALPVVLSVAFARPWITTALSVLALALAMVTALVNDYLASTQGWIRLSVLVGVCVVSVGLAAIARRAVVRREEAQRELRVAHARLDGAMQSDLDPRLLLEPLKDDAGDVVDFVYLDVNRAAAEYVAREARDLVGRRMLEAFPGAERSALWPRYVDVARTGTPLILNGQPYTSLVDDRARVVDIRAFRVDGNVSMTWRDMTEAYDVQERLRESEEHFRLIAENSSDVVILAQRGAMTWLSPSLTTVMGWQPGDWIGHEIEEFTHPDDVAAIARSRAEVTGGRTVVGRFRIRDSAGSYHWTEIHGGPFISAEGRVSGIVASFRVIDAEVEAATELDLRARHDALTGLLNRKEVLERVADVLLERRSGEHVAVLFCDVDRFKEINDQRGHAFGDEVLRVVASRIAMTIRATDLAARVGGDEFLVVLFGVGDLDEAVVVAENVRRAAGDDLAIGGAETRASLSIGVTLAVAGEPADGLVQRADFAMYEAKRGGRGRVVAVAP